MSAPKHWDELKTLHSLNHNQESDLRLSINSPIGLVTLWVLVEGDADPYFYERLFDNNRTKVVKVGKRGKDGKLYGGNIVVKELVRNLLALGWTRLVIGIIDRDWRTFKKDAKQNLPSNIFETDRRDLEMTLLSYPSLRMALKQEVIKTMNPNHIRWFKNGYWYKNSGDWFRDVWEQCSMLSRYMGSLRIVASHFELPRLDFSLSECCDESQHSICCEWEAQLFRSAVNQTGCYYIQLLYYCWIVKLRYDLNHRDVYDVCRGHDFLSVLSAMLIDKSHYSEKWMTFFMTKEISASEIIGMRLFQNIDKWALSVGVTMAVH